MATETQTYLNEVAAPSIITGAQIRACIRAAARDVMRETQQAARFAELLQQADMTEADAELRAKANELFQKLGAFNRITSEITRHLRDLNLTVDRYAALQQEFKTRAQSLGYTV